MKTALQRAGIDLKAQSETQGEQTMPKKPKRMISKDTLLPLAEAHFARLEATAEALDKGTIASAKFHLGKALEALAIITAKLED